MKKALFIILAIVLVVAVGVTALVVSLNKEKDPITAAEFKNAMESKGYVITDAADQFAQYDFVEDVYIAVSADNTYQIEFYVISDAETAVAFYNHNKSIFEESKSNTSASSNVSMKNYSKYTLSTDGRYKVLSRIDNTVIYLNVDNSYKSAVKDALKAIGY